LKLHTTPNFEPHSLKQDRALGSDKPIIVCATGIQWGKTTVGANKMRMAIHSYTHPDDTFLVTAPTYKIMLQSTMPAFLKIMAGTGTFSKADMSFKLWNGRMVYFRTATDPSSVVGVTNVRFIWCDEVGLYPLIFWENIQARAAFRQAQIILTTSPYTLNWLYQEIIRPIMKRGPAARADVELVQARSDENPYFPVEYYEAKKKTMDPRRFQMMFGGEWNKFVGLVYDCFDTDAHIVDPFPLPSGTKFYAGVDWGYTNASAITVRAVTPEGYHYQVAEMYEKRKVISDIVDRAMDLKRVWNIERFYCDPAMPAYIEEFCRNGLTAIAADNDIRAGIDAHYALIKAGHFKLFRGKNKYTEDEIETYHYPDDEDNRGPNQDYRERLPVARDNHALDAARYVSIHTHRQLYEQPVMVGQELEKKKKENYEERYKRLTSLKDRHLTEEWS
jgi:PBSX family phage terminase large subunit